MLKMLKSRNNLVVNHDMNQTQCICVDVSILVKRNQELFPSPVLAYSQASCLQTMYKGRASSEINTF